ncbi:helix-turn-helix transcriptional regulator [uncultured Clostridium sp.]|uniref:helix-turn-helix domain-containing protein n=1 Tax=uncultured Clostridium sp. TaxID=59620 RepID=UPI0025D0AEED|nr:helix-turn-helix transcriptional regulator [uncultured Clostridium sp.]
MEFFEKVGMNISDILKEKGWTNTELATRIGVSKQVMGKILKGQKAINALEINDISLELGVSVEELIKDRNESIQEPVLMFMGNINDDNKSQFEFLSLVIKEIIDMEDILNE